MVSVPEAAQGVSYSNGFNFLIFITLMIHSCYIFTSRLRSNRSTIKVTCFMVERGRPEMELGYVIMHVKDATSFASTGDPDPSKAVNIFSLIHNSYQLSFCVVCEVSEVFTVPFRLLIHYSVPKMHTGVRCNQNCK